MYNTLYISIRIKNKKQRVEIKNKKGRNNSKIKSERTD